MQQHEKKETANRVLCSSPILEERRAHEILVLSGRDDGAAVFPPVRCLVCARNGPIPVLLAPLVSPVFFGVGGYIELALRTAV